MKVLDCKCPHCVLGTLGPIRAKWCFEIPMMMPKHIYARGPSVRYLEGSNEP